MKHNRLLFWTVSLLIGLLANGLGAQPNQNSAARAGAQVNLTVSGYIKDADNGEGLIGVSVYVKELNTGAVTNSYGFYAITAPVGIYSLVVSYVGYKKQPRKREPDRPQRAT